MSLQSVDIVHYFLQQIDLARTKPSSIINHLKERRFLEDNQFVHSQLANIRYKTEEGKAAVEEAITHLENMKPVGKLKLSGNFCEAAFKVGSQMARQVHIENPEPYQKLLVEELKKLGMTSIGDLWIIVDYGFRMDPEIIPSIIVDDGDPSRTRRDWLLHQRAKFIGLIRLYAATGANRLPGGKQVRMFMQSFLTDPIFNISISDSQFMNQSSQRLQSSASSHHIISLNHSKIDSTLRNSSTNHSLKNLSLSRIGHSGTFGTSSRGDLFASQVCSPSAKYNLKSSFEVNLAEKKGSSMSCGRDSLSKSNFSYFKKSCHPGPGAYNPQKPKTKKKVVIGLKNKQQLKQPFLNEKMISDNPAPSKYHIKDVPLSGGKIVSLSLRFNQDKENKPGPGTYFKAAQTTATTPKASVFGISERTTYFEKESSRSISPGPGQYRLHSQFR